MRTPPGVCGIVGRSGIFEIFGSVLRPVKICTVGGRGTSGIFGIFGSVLRPVKICTVWDGIVFQAIRVFRLGYYITRELVISDVLTGSVNLRCFIGSSMFLEISDV